MFGGQKVQYHFLRIQTSLRSFQVTGVHAGNEKRRLICSPNHYFAAIPYDDTNTLCNFIFKCG